tara:strand:+ start:451 stop:1095 length:645 start_codon:yes stop_codon:yes gene_type:complete
MTLKLLTKKLELSEEKFIESHLIKDYCNKLNLGYNVAIRYLVYNKRLYRILRGIFYKPSIKERKLGMLEINHIFALIEALKRKKIKNWYFGLESAIKLNNLAHEYFAVDYIVNDTIFRAKPIKILGHKVKFVKVKKKLCTFGIKANNKIKFSDIEKTVLDMIYLLRYDGLNNTEIKSKIKEYIKHCSKDKLIKYSEKYNKKLIKFVGELVEKGN